MELKTLKDLRYWKYKKFKGYFNGKKAEVQSREDWILSKDLKQEAIKWAKKWAGYDRQVVLMEFFNLTEEDLK